MGEIKRSPYTSVAALGCLSLSAYLWLNTASAGDVNALQQQIAEVRETVRRESAKGELNNVRRELFDITLRINTLEREHINVDDLLYRRRDELTAAQRRLEAKLQAMDANE